MTAATEEFEIEVWEMLRIPFYFVVISNLLANFYMIFALKANNLLQTISFRFILAVGVSECIQAVVHFVTLIIIEVSYEVGFAFKYYSLMFKYNT